MDNSTPLNDILVNMSDAFVGTVRDMYNPVKKPSAATVRTRRLYLSLLALLLILVGNLFFANM